MANGERNIRDVIKEEVAGGVRQGFTVASGIFSSAMSETIDDVKTIFGGLGKTAMGIMGLATSPIRPFMNMAGMGGEEEGEKSDSKMVFEQWRQLNGINNKLERIAPDISKMVDKQEDTIERLSDIENHFKQDILRRKREFKDKSLIEKILDSLVLFFSTITFGIGLAMGAMTRTIMLPFEVVVKTFTKMGKLVKDSKVLSLVGTGLTKLGNVFTRIDDFVTKGKITSILSRFFGMFTRIGNVVKQSKALGFITSALNTLKNVFGTVSRIGTKLAKLPIISGLAAGFMKGFTKLFLPLQIIMSVIDFVKGFMGEKEGSIIDKIKAGLIGVVEGFLDLPVKLLGWISDWILGLFNIKIEGGSAKKIMEGIKSTVSFALDVIIFPFKMLYNAIQGLISISKILDTKFGLFEDIGNIVKSVFDIIFFPFKAVWSGLKILWNLLKGDTEGAAEEAKNLFSSLIDLGKTVFKGIVAVIKWGTPIGWIYLGLKAAWDFFKSNKNEEDGIFSSLINLAKKVFGGLATILKWRTPIGWLYMGLESLWNFFKSDKNKDKSLFDIIKEKLSKLGGAIKNWILDKIPGANLLFGDKEELSKNMEKKVKAERDKKLDDDVVKVSKEYTKYLHEKNVVNINRLGKSEIENWDEIRKLRPQEIQKVINYGDWSDNTLSRLIEIKEERSRSSVSANVSAGESIRETEKETMEYQLAKEAKKYREEKKVREENRKSQERMAKTADEQTNQLKGVNNNVSVMNQNINSISRGGTEKDVPDEIENMSILFMNKSNLGVAT